MIQHFLSPKLTDPPYRAASLELLTPGMESKFWNSGGRSFGYSIKLQRATASRLSVHSVSKGSFLTVNEIFFCGQWNISDVWVEALVQTLITKGMDTFTTTSLRIDPLFAAFHCEITSETFSPFKRLSQVVIREIPAAKRSQSENDIHSWQVCFAEMSGYLPRIFHQSKSDSRVDRILCMRSGHRFVLAHIQEGDTSQQRLTINNAPLTSNTLFSQWVRRVPSSPWSSSSAPSKEWQPKWSCTSSWIQ